MQADCDETLKVLSDVKGDIEELLRQHAVNTDLGKTFRRCIRKSFALRHAAVFGKRDIPLKYKAYSYMLCLVENGDAIITFNYDTSLERTIENANRSDKEHVGQPRIPPECLECVQKLKYQLQPAKIFDKQPCATGTTAFDLVKVHGSINWEWNKPSGQLTALDSLGEPDRSFLVYPDPEKQEAANKPAKDLMAAAKEMVGSAQLVVIAGYSFPESDQEKHPFVSYLRDALPKKKRVIIIDPNPSTTILEVATKPSRVVFFLTKFEMLFSSENVHSLARFLDREPHLSSK